MSLWCKIRTTKSGYKTYSATYTYKENGKVKSVVLYSIGAKQFGDPALFDPLIDEERKQLENFDVDDWLKRAAEILDIGNYGDKITKEMAIKNAWSNPYLYKIKPSHWYNPQGLIKVIAKKRDQIEKAERMIINKIDAKKYSSVILGYQKVLELAEDKLKKIVNTLC